MYISISISNRGLILSYSALSCWIHIFQHPYLLFTVYKKETNGEIWLLEFSPGGLGRCRSLLYYPRPRPASADIYRVAWPWSRTLTSTRPPSRRRLLPVTEPDGLLQPYRLSTQVSRLSCTGNIVETLPLWLSPVPVLLSVSLRPAQPNPIRPYYCDELQKLANSLNSPWAWVNTDRVRE